MSKQPATLEELKTALQKAISVYQYASMTRYEREACADDMKYAEAVAERAGINLDE